MNLPLFGRRLCTAAPCLILPAIVALATTLSPRLSAADYLVDFEGGAEKPSYAEGTVTLNGIDWQMTNALIGGTDSDYKIDAFSARLRGYSDSAITMLGDKADGVDSVSFNYGGYGTDAQVAWAVEYSTNAGTDWTQLGVDFMATETPAVFSEPLNLEGSIRIRIISRADQNSNRRVNVDNILITDFSGADNTPPEISSLDPDNGASGVALDTLLTINFNESVTAATGNIVLYQGSDDAVVESIPVDSGSVVVNGPSVSITTAASLTESAAYYVQIDAGAFTDGADNPFAGISDKTTWAFTAIDPDTAPPVIESLVPENGATSVEPDETLIINFDELVQPVTGSITLFDAAGDSVVEAFDVTSAVLFFNNQVFITPSNPLEFGTSYYVQIDSGAISDAAGNAFDGITDKTTWAFGLPGIPSLTPEGYTQDFAEFVSMETVPEGWSFTGPRLDYADDWAAGFSSGFRGNASVLGYQHTGSTDLLEKILTLKNDTGAEITDLTIAYKGRVARETEGRTPVYSVSLDGEEVEALSFSTEDGDNQQRQASITDLAIADGASFQIVWSSERGNGSGSSKQIGISDVSIAIGTSVIPPSLSGPTLQLATLTSTSVDADAEVLTDGGASITVRGFVFSETATNPLPEIGGTGVTDLPDGSAEVGEFTTMLTGLSPETAYTLRAYATNAEGTSYTDVLDFSTLASPPTFTMSYSERFDDFDGTLPVGWTALSSNDVNNYAGDWGSGSSAGFRGGVNSPGVLGYQHTSGSGELTVTLKMINGTGAVLNELYFSYLGRAERVDQNRSPEWSVSINGSDEVAELGYSTLDGVDKTVTAQLVELGIADGAEFTISWTSSRGEPSGSSKQIGLAKMAISTEEIADSDYDSWAADNNVIEGPDGDDDKDSLTNLLEYGLGLDPQVPDGTPGTFEDGLLSYAKGAEAVANGDVTWTIETSPNLMDPWTTVTPDVDDATTISYTLPADQGKIFSRLRVTQN